jgi:hypothetical protein
MLLAGLDVPFEVIAHLKTTVSIWLLRQPTAKNGKSPFDATPYRNAFHLMLP